MMKFLNLILVIFLVACALAVERTNDLLSAVIIYASYSLIMAVLWLFLMAPDIALTEAAIGAGVTTILLIGVVSRTRRME